MTRKPGFIIASNEWGLSPEEADYLESNGYTLLASVTTGEEAIRITGELSPDIILLDIELGGMMDGIETSRKAREITSAPIIYITHNPGKECVIRACETAPYGFLLRPFSKESLLANIEMARCQYDNEIRIRELINTLPDMVYEIDEKGGIRFLSDNITRLFGYSKGEIHTIADMLGSFIPEDRERAIVNFGKTMSGIPGKEVEYTITRKDGTRVPISILATPIMDGATCRGSRGVVRDISERVQQRELLVESEEKYRTLVENINDVHAILDMNGVITYVSPAIERLGLYTTSELVGRNFMEFVHREDLPVLMDMHGKTLAGIRRPDEYRMVDKDGKSKWVRTSSSLIIRKGIAVGISSLMTDISEKRRLEEEIITISEKERMSIGQDLHDGIGQYFTGLGYLFRTLMDMIPKKSKKVMAAAEEISNLITEAKKHVQIVSKGYYPVGMDSRGIIMAISELCSSIEHRYNIACTFIYGEEILIRDNETATHIYYIINEAVNNAIKHGKAKNILIMMEKRNERMYVSVEDDGTGIEGDSDTTGGLGLNIMRYRATIIGGTLKIAENEPSGVIVAVGFTPK
jgi:PAS domain S-box-containing protein